MQQSPHVDETRERLRSLFRGRIPAGITIATAAVNEAIHGHEDDTDWLKTNFSRLVEEVQINAYHEYLAHEKAAAAYAIRTALTEITGENASADDIFDVMESRFSAIDGFFLGLTQGRRARAGKAFEVLLHTLFTNLRYPFVSQPVINGQPDFVLPSLEYFKSNPIDCIIFTAKRTLRERWRQIVTEGTRGLGFFLATIDEKVSKRDLSEMLSSRIHLVIPERIKAARVDYQKAPNVITFEHFFKYHLDPAMERWRVSSVIE